MTQAVTETKSATNDGIEHLRMAELPRITYSLFTSESYGWWTTTREGEGRFNDYHCFYYKIVAIKGEKMALDTICFAVFPSF